MTESNSNSSSIHIRLLLKSFNCPSCNKIFKILVKPNELISKCPTCSYELCPETKEKEQPQRNDPNQLGVEHHISVLTERSISREIYGNIISDIDNSFISHLLNSGLSDFVIVRRINFQNGEENKCVKVEHNIIEKLKHFKMDKKLCKQKENGEIEFPKCIICLLEINEGIDSILLPCEHIYHEKCIIQWFKTHNTCPLCRFEITGEKFKNDSCENDRNQNNQMILEDID